MDTRPRCKSHPPEHRFRKRDIKILKEKVWEKVGREARQFITVEKFGIESNFARKIFSAADYRFLKALNPEQLSSGKQIKC